MNKLDTFFRKTKYILRHDFYSIENIVLIVAIILCFFWTIQSINAMTRNWELSERLATERKNLELLSLEVEAAELENEYLKTSEYQELVSRRNLDKKLPGENMVVMPENSDAAKSKHKKAQPENSEAESSNLKKWFRFLFPAF